MWVWDVVGVVWGWGEGGVGGGVGRGGLCGEGYVCSVIDGAPTGMDNVSLHGALPVFYVVG